MTDRIDTVIYADDAAYDEIKDALSEYSEYVAAQTLSLSLSLKRLGEAPSGAAIIGAIIDHNLPEGVVLSLGLNQFLLDDGFELSKFRI